MTAAVFTDRTLAALVRSLRDRYQEHAQLTDLFREADVAHLDPGRAVGLHPRIQHVVYGLAGRRDDYGTDERQDSKRLHALLTAHLTEEHQGLRRRQEGSWNSRLQLRESVKKLTEALRANGWEVTESGHLQPLTEPPADLPPAQHRLIELLAQHGLNGAAHAYKQALDCWRDPNKLEAGNGQLRVCLEALVVDLARQRGLTAHDFGDALKRLHGAGLLDRKEKAYLEALWALSSDRGPHRGLTDEDEAQFRVHVTTATATYLVARFFNP
jgi:DNA-binding MarR family transcriptional regulator